MGEGNLHRPNCPRTSFTLPLNGEGFSLQGSVGSSCGQFILLVSDGEPWLQRRHRAPLHTSSCSLDSGTVGHLCFLPFSCKWTRFCFVLFPNGPLCTAAGSTGRISTGSACSLVSAPIAGPRPAGVQNLCCRLSYSQAIKSTENTAWYQTHALWNLSLINSEQKMKNNGCRLTFLSWAQSFFLQKSWSLCSSDDPGCSSGSPEEPEGKWLLLGFFVCFFFQSEH